jgi:hypothetical protein
MHTDQIGNSNLEAVRCPDGISPVEWRFGNDEVPMAGETALSSARSLSSRRTPC